MRIVIDGRRLDSSTGTYGRNLLKYLEKIDSKNEYIVLTLPSDKRWQPTAKNFRVEQTHYDHYTFGEQLGFAKLLYSLKPDLVHFLMPQQPLLYFGKRVTTVHDLTLVYFQNLDKNKIIYTIEQTIFKFLLKNVARRSAIVITPTNYVKKDLAGYAKIAEEKIVVTLEAGEASSDVAEPVKALQDQKFLFQVSNAFPYKNLQLLVDGFVKLKNHHPDLHLALAGKKDHFFEKLEAQTMADGVKNIHFLGFVSEGQKRWLFENAAAHVNPSRSEGFGLQTLDALVYGTPMALSSATCLPEVAGETALYFSPDSADELADQVQKILDGDQEAKNALSRYKKQLAKYSWHKMANETLSIYQKVLQKPSK